MNIINKTPHTINLLKRSEDQTSYSIILKIPPSEEALRLRTESNLIGYVIHEKINSLSEIIYPLIPFKKVSYGTADMPIEKTGTYYVVSQMIQDAFPKRKDLLVPYDIVRDEEGNIIGCLSFKVNSLCF